MPDLANYIAGYNEVPVGQVRKGLSAAVRRRLAERGAGRKAQDRAQQLQSTMALVQLIAALRGGQGIQASAQAPQGDPLALGREYARYGELARLANSRRMNQRERYVAPYSSELRSELDQEEY